MARTIFVLNGPNLNLLGVREPAIYGTQTLEDIKNKCIARARTHALEINFRQSNFEGVMIESVHEAREKAVGIVINPAGLSFHSIPLLDSLRVRLKTSSRIAELSQHEADGGELQEGEAAAVEIFPVLGEAAAAIEPSNRAFYDPTLG